MANTDLTASPDTKVKAKIWHGRSVHNMYTVMYGQRKRNTGFAGVSGQNWASHLNYLSFGCSSAEYDGNRQWLLCRIVMRLPEAISTKIALWGRKTAIAFLKELLYAWAVYCHLIQPAPKYSKIEMIFISLLGSQRLNTFHKAPQLINSCLELSPVLCDLTQKPFYSIRLTSKG